MTKRDVLSVALRVVGGACLIYLAVAIIQAAFLLARGLSRQGSTILSNQWSDLIWLVVIPAYFVTVGLVLMRCARRLTCLLLREEDKPSFEEGIPWQRRVFVLSLRVVGVVCVLRALPMLFQLFPRQSVLAWHAADFSLWVLFEGLSLMMVSTYLLFGGRALVALAFLQGEGGYEE